MRLFHPLLAAGITAALLLWPLPGRTETCTTSACFSLQADGIEVSARKRQGNLAIKRREFTDWVTFEEARIHAMKETVRIYRALAQIRDSCQSDQGRNHMELVMNQLSKIRLGTQDLEQARLSRQYIKNASAELARAQNLCSP